MQGGRTGGGGVGGLGLRCVSGRCVEHRRARCEGMVCQMIRWVYLK